MQFQNKKAGTGPSWHPAQVSKNEVSSNMQRTLILKLLSVSQCRKIPQEIRRRLGNHFSSNWKQKKSFFFRVDEIELCRHQLLYSTKISTQTTTTQT